MFRGHLLKSGWCLYRWVCELDLAFAVRCKSGEVQTQWKLLISCNHSKGCKRSLCVFYKRKMPWVTWEGWGGYQGDQLHVCRNLLYHRLCFITTQPQKLLGGRQFKEHKAKEDDSPIPKRSDWLSGNCPGGKVHWLKIQWNHIFNWSN